METQPVRDAVPVTKTEVDPNAANEPSGRNPDLYGNDGPVMKSDLTPEKEEMPDMEEPEEGEGVLKNALTESFMGLMNRMDNLYKD